MVYENDAFHLNLRPEVFCVSLVPWYEQVLRIGPLKRKSSIISELV